MPDIDLMGATYPDVPAVDLPKSGGGTARFYDPSGIDYAGSPTSGGNANMANAILYGAVDSTSTSTAFTATVAGLTELVDGTTVVLRNGVVTSASGFTINVNGLGALPVYNNMTTGNAVTPTNPTRDTTIFNINYTMAFTYVESDIVAGGAWICWRGYDANTNTIGYQLRTNSTVRNVSDTARYYKIYFTSADGSMWVPASVNSTNNATSARPVNQRPIDPFGPIVYTSANTNYAAGANLAATTIWEQYALVLGYSFNRTGAALTLTAESPVYVKCAPQAAGGVIMDADEPIVQALPSTKDGKVYIYLGLAYDATHIELQIWHPVYWHDGTGIRLWTGAEPSSGGSTVTVTPSLTSGTQVGTISVDGTSTTLYAPTPPTVPSAASTTPAMDGTAAVGTATTYARADHVHPTDTSRQATLVSGTNIKTINNESLLGSGNITISGGGGGSDMLTFYVSSLTTSSTPYVDSALTTTAFEHYGYDLDAAWADVSAAGSIRLIQGYGTSNMRIAFVTCAIYDRPEDAVELEYATRGTYYVSSIM